MGKVVITPVLSRRRNATLVVRREDALRGPGARARSRRAHRGSRWGSPTRFGAIAVSVLLTAALAWLLVFVYLLALVH